MKKWKRILSVMLAVLLLSGSLPVRAVETVDPEEPAGNSRELKKKLERLIPKEDLGKYEKKKPIGEARLGNEVGNTTSFFAAEAIPGNDHTGNTSCIRVLEHYGVFGENRNGSIHGILCGAQQSDSIRCLSGVKTS